MPQQEHSGQEDSDTMDFSDSCDESVQSSSHETNAFDRSEPQVAGSDMQTIDDKDRTHVTMEVTMDIRDMEPKEKEAICTLARQYEDSFQELKNKNEDYGYAFLRAGSKLAQSNGTPFDSEIRSQAFGLLTRIGDKHERLIENVYGNGSAEVSDGPEITAKEASNYYQLLSMVLANPQLARELAEN